MPLKCNPAWKIVDDSGFPRTPDRLLELCGTHVWWLEVFKTITSTYGPYYLGGSATLDELFVPQSCRCCAYMKEFFLGGGKNRKKHGYRLKEQETKKFFEGLE
jgi:hypothetical protein